MMESSTSADSGSPILEKGMIDPVGGKQELDQIQGQLLEIVKTLRLHAGVEDEEPK